MCFLFWFPFACPLCCSDRLIALRKVQFEINISRLSNFSKGEKHLADIFEDWEPCWSRDVTKVRAWPWISRRTLQNKTIKVASWPPSYLTECCSQKGKQIIRMQIMPLFLFAQLSSFVEEGRFTNLVTNSMGHYSANRCIKWVFLQMHFVLGVIQGQTLYSSPNLYLRAVLLTRKQNSMHFPFRMSPNFASECEFKLAPIFWGRMTAVWVFHPQVHLFWTVMHIAHLWVGLVTVKQHPLLRIWGLERQFSTHALSAFAHKWAPSVIIWNCNLNYLKVEGWT